MDMAMEDKPPLPPPSASEGEQQEEASSTPTTTTTTAPPNQAAAATEAEEEEEPEPPLELTLEIEVPTGKVLTLQHIQKAECGIGIRTILQEYAESSFYTSYKLVVKGTKPEVEINDFVDLNEYECLVEGTRLVMVLEEYDVKKARHQVRRMKELLAFPPIVTKEQLMVEQQQQLQEGGEGETALTNKAKAEGGAEGEGEGEGEGNPPDELTKEEVMAMLDRLPKVEFPIKVSLDRLYPTILGPLAEQREEFIVPACVKSITYSGWNPPPAARKLVGDLLYLEVVTLEGVTLHITGTAAGFYVNKTQGDTFDPTPATPAHFAHELLLVLAAACPGFTMAWARAVQETTKHAYVDDPLTSLAANIGMGRMEAVMPMKAPWLVPPPSSISSSSPSGEEGNSSSTSATSPLTRHRHDTTRTEDDLLNTYGMDDRGALRDWNEDYQSARAMPVETIGDKIVQAKFLHKVLSDFADAAVVGAMAVIQGHVSPINPNEPTKSHVYVYNNIFFSYAAETHNTFRVIEGDRPAFKGALHEVRNLIRLNKSGVSKLHTLATSVVDYLGVRVVCQSIIPGILSGDQQSRLIYGSVEPGVPLQAKEEMHALLKEASSKAFYLAERRLPKQPIKPKENQDPASLAATAAAIAALAQQAEEDKHTTESMENDDGTVTFLGPVEWKGLKGSDGRCYMLDLLRVTPRDPNYIKENWQNPAGSGTGVWERVAVCEGVPPLEEDLSVVLRPELMHIYVRNRVLLLREKIVGEYRQRKALEKEKKKGEEGKVAPVGEGGEEEEEEEEEEMVVDEETQLLLKEEEEELMERLKVNPNAFLPLDGVEDVDQVAKDEEQIRVLGRFLWSELLPSFLENVKSGRATVIDGEMLTDNLHESGINVRYIGRLATMVKEMGPNAVDTQTQTQTHTSAPTTQANLDERRFRAPEFFVQVCETEMVARAVKHVVFDIFRERPELRACPAPALIAVLNAVLGNVEPAAAATQTHTQKPTVTTTNGVEGDGPGSPTGGKKKKKKKSKGAAGGGGGAAGGSNNKEEEEEETPSPPPSPTVGGGGGGGSGSGGKKNKKSKGKGNNKGMNGVSSSSATAAAEAATNAAVAALFFTTPITSTPTPTPTLTTTLETLREQVLADIRLNYRYSSPTLLRTPHPNPLALLRRISQKLGLRIYARAYNFTNTREPFTVADLADIQPTSKHSTPPAPLEEVKEMLDSAKLLAQTGNINAAFQYAQQAHLLAQQVLGPIHVEVAKCMELSATIIFQAGSPEVGLEQLKKALAIYWQTVGCDSFEAINAHHTLGLFLQNMRGKFDEAIFHFHACIYLLELIAGPYSPELPSQYLKLGQAYHILQKYQEAYTCQSLAVGKSKHIADTLQEAATVHSLACLEEEYTLYKEALAHEKRAYNIYKNVLGENHRKTIEASVAMSKFTQKAVERAVKGVTAPPPPQQQLRTGGGLNMLNAGVKKGGKVALAAAENNDDSWVTDLEGVGVGGGGGGKKKKKGGKK